MSDPPSFSCDDYGVCGVPTVHHGPDTDGAILARPWLLPQVQAAPLVLAAGTLQLHEGKPTEWTWAGRRQTQAINMGHILSADLSM